MRTLCIAALYVAGASACDGGGEPDGIDSGPAADAGVRPPVPPLAVSIEPIGIGTPPWRPAGFMLFSTAVGTDESRFTEALGLLTTVHAPGHRPYPQAGLFGPDRSHAGPYDDELAAALIANGQLASTCFRPEDFAAPSGVVLVSVVVPDGPANGRSPDFDSGPIIPDVVFPLTVTGGRGATTFSTTIPPLATLVPGGGDGYSHIPLAFGANTDLDGVPPPVPPGRYEWRLLMMDARGSGWSVGVPFSVLDDDTPCDFFGPQGTFDDAVPVTVATVNARICDAPDFYRIRDAGSFRVSVSYDPCGDLDVHVYDADRNETMVAAGPESPHMLTVPGMSYIEVRGATPGATGPYVLTIATP